MLLRLVFAWLLLVTACPAATWYVDSTAGSDSNDGTTRGALSGGHGAWATWGKWVSKLNAVALGPDDHVDLRPGRYHVSDGSAGNWNITGPGGTPNHPITIEVDQFYPGNVEVVGSIAPGVAITNVGVNTNAAAWQPALTCAGGDTPNVPCDTAADCGAGACSNAPTGVWWTRVNSNIDSTGTAPGIAFQPNSTPGGPPRFFETLFSPVPSPLHGPITMPSFTAGHDQSWTYTERNTNCSGAHNPWRCCTKLHTGSGVNAGDAGCVGGACCGATNGTINRDGRVYVQTASGVRPDLASPPVEVPYGGASIFFFNASGASPTHDLLFSNAGKRTTFFWWGETNLLQALNAHDIVFHDFEFRYNAERRVTGLASSIPDYISSGSAFPPDNGGPMYLVAAAAANNHTAYNFTFADGTIGDSGGDELGHWNHYEANGTCASGTNVGLPCLDTRANPQCPLGTTPQTYGTCTVDTTPCLTASDCLNVSLGAASAICDCALPVNGTCPGPGGQCIYARNGHNTWGPNLILENSPSWAPDNTAPNTNSPVLRAVPANYAGLGWDAIYLDASPLGMGGQSASCIIDQCPFETFVNVTTRNCQNFSAENPTNALSEAVLWGWVVKRCTFDFLGAKKSATASAVLHPANIVTTCDGGPVGPVCKGFSGIRGFNMNPTYAYTNVPGILFENNLIKNGYGMPFQMGPPGAVVGHSPQFAPHRVVGNTFELMGDTDFTQIAGQFVDGQVTLSAHFDGVFEDNLLWQHVPLATGRASLLISPTNTLVLDYNGYFNVAVWTLSADAASLAAWQTMTGQESHSLFGDPLLVGGVPFNYDLQGASPLKDHGINLAYLTDDIHQTPRPQNIITDISASEVPAGAVSTTTVTTSTSTSSTNVLPTTSTSSTTTSTNTTSTNSTIPGTAGKRKRRGAGRQKAGRM